SAVAQQTPKPWRAEYRALFALGAPIALTQLVQMSVQTVDVLMIGRLGAEPLAAAALGVVFFFTVFIVGLGAGVAITPMVSQALGRDPDNVDEVRSAVRMGLWLAAMIFPFGFVFMANATAIARLLGQPDHLAELAGPYVLALSPSLFFMTGVSILRNFLAAIGRTRAPLIFIIATTFLNAGLNYLLIYGSFGFPRWELVGAGIASTISHGFGFLALVLFCRFDEKARRFRVFRDLFKPDWPRLREVVALGAPIAVTIAFEGMLFNSCVFLMGRIGVDEVAAYQVVLNVASIAFMAPLGFSMAGATRIGLAAGAGDQEGVRRAAVATVVVCAASMVLFWLPIMPFPSALVGFYLDVDRPENASVVALATAFVPVAAAFALFDATQVAFNQCLRGLKDVRAPMVITGVSYWLIGFPLAFWLGLRTDAGAVGVWWGLLVALGFVSLWLGLRLFRQVRSGGWRRFSEPATAVSS
ncbi:MAG: MATE family efflux transporter, partial [Parvularculaceae bacterium]|nr:MATE family efflux transporter [Parvularculaceae bacterium]